MQVRYEEGKNLKIGTECKLVDVISYASEIRCFPVNKIRPRYELRHFGKATRYTYFIEKNSKTRIYLETVKVSNIYSEIDLVFDKQKRIIARRKKRKSKLKFVKPKKVNDERAWAD